MLSITRGGNLIRKIGSVLISVVRLVAVGTLIIVAAIGLGAPSSSFHVRLSDQESAQTSDASSGSGCPPLMFFGIRGSGENGKGYDYGYGQEILSMKNYLHGLVPGMESEPITYPAISVLWWDTRYKVDYAKSVSEGVSDVMTEYANFESDCPQTPIVLAGYSQGVDVAYQASSLLPEAARSRVIIVGFGDPHFNPGQSWADAGNYYHTLFGVLVTMWDEQPHMWPSGYAPHLRSWCLHGDDICNFTGVRILTCAVSCTHETGYINSGYTGDAASWAYLEWKKLPAPSVSLPLPPSPTSSAPAGSAVWTASEAPGGNSACAIQTGGTLWCWGYNGYGQLGLGNETTEQLPTRVGTGTTWASVSGGDTWACAIRTDGTLWCWGDNNYGQLGTGDKTNRLTPTQVGTAATWKAVSAGAGNTCAIRTGGTLWCWGDNSQGELGTGDTANQLTPTQVGTATDWATISAGAEDPCATRTDGTLWCWGLNSNGQLGTGDTANRLTPTQVGTATNWATVSADDSTCATRTAGTLWCWGAGSDGQLGTGTTDNQLTPVQVGTATTWAKVTSGQDFACATQQDGTLWCWGANSSGELGIGNQTSTLIPARVGTATNWNSVAASIYVSVCATRTDHTLWCWGDGGDGQLGTGNTNSQLTPTQVQ